MDLSNYVEHTEFPQVDNGIQASQRFLQTMAKRRSIRQFSDQPVPREVIENAILAAGSAPSGANLQPWKFVVIEDPEVKKAIRQEAELVETKFYQERAPKTWLNALRPLGTDENKEYLEIAPTLIAVFAEHSEKGGKITYYPTESTGIATGLLLAGLHHAGLGTLTHTPKPMQFLNRLLDIPSRFRPFVLVVTGYPQLPVQVPNIQRKSLSEIAEFF